MIFDDNANNAKDIITAINFTETKTQHYKKQLADLVKPICSRCLYPVIEYHSQHKDMCKECGNNYDMVERLRLNLAPFNPPNNAKFKNLTVNGERRTYCPNCGSKADIYGVIGITVNCKFCGIILEQFNNGIVVARSNRGYKTIPYLTNDHLPFFERDDGNSIKMENFKESKESKDFSLKRLNELNL